MHFSAKKILRENDCGLKNFLEECQKFGLKNQNMMLNLNFTSRNAFGSSLVICSKNSIHQSSPLSGKFMLAVGISDARPIR